MFCTRCGSQVEDGSSFCDRCGADLRPAVQSNAANAQAASAGQAAAPAAVSQAATPVNVAAAQAAAPGHTTAIPANAPGATAAAPSPAQAPASAPAQPAAAAPAAALASAQPAASVPHPAAASAQGVGAAQMPNSTVPPAYNPVAAVAGAATAAAATPAKAKGGKGKKGLIIGVVIALVVIAAAIVVYFTVLAPKPCYVVKQRIDNMASKSSSQTYEYDLSGVLLSKTTQQGGKTDKVEYKELVDGLYIWINDTATYTQNSDGYVTGVEISDSDGKKYITRSYEYFSPGIIKCIKINDLKNNTSTETIYNEDGWITSYKSVAKDGKATKTNYTYSDAGNGNKVTCTASVEGSSSNTVFIYEVDDNGKVTNKYKEDNPSACITFSYEKIDQPKKMVAATARLQP